MAADVDGGREVQQAVQDGSGEHVVGEDVARRAGMGGAQRSGSVIPLNKLRLTVSRQESLLRSTYEWTILAENWWPHAGQDLTASPAPVERRRRGCPDGERGRPPSPLVGKASSAACVRPRPVAAQLVSDSVGTTLCGERRTASGHISQIRPRFATPFGLAQCDKPKRIIRIGCL